MNTTTVTIGGRDFKILFADLLRPLNDRERLNLKNSINRRGVIVPIIVDEHDNIIDGANRATLAAELGLKNVRTDVRKNLNLDEKMDLCLLLNECRRHLSPSDIKKQKEERGARTARVKELHKAGVSTRTIADAEGVSQPQVLKDLGSPSDAPDNQLSPASSPVTKGRDGKSYAPPEVKEARAEKIVELQSEGLSQRQIAEQIGVSQSQVSRARKAVESAQAPSEVKTNPRPPFVADPPGYSDLLAAWLMASEEAKRLFFQNYLQPKG